MLQKFQSTKPPLVFSDVQSMKKIPPNKNLSSTSWTRGTWVVSTSLSCTCTAATFKSLDTIPSTKKISYLEKISWTKDRGSWWINWISNPNKAYSYRGNPSKLPYHLRCSLNPPQNGSHLMRPEISNSGLEGWKISQPPRSWWSNCELEIRRTPKSGKLTVNPEYLNV